MPRMTSQLSCARWHATDLCHLMCDPGLGNRGGGPWSLSLHATHRLGSGSSEGASVTALKVDGDGGLGHDHDDGLAVMDTAEGGDLLSGHHDDPGVGGASLDAHWLHQTRLRDRPLHHKCPGLRHGDPGPLRCKSCLGMSSAKPGTTRQGATTPSPVYPGRAQGSRTRREGSQGGVLRQPSHSAFRVR